MFFAKSIAVLTLLMTQLQCASAYPLGGTNSDRLARGLPPAPPRFGRTLPGRADSPTPAFAAKRSKPSQGQVWYSGRLEVRDSQDHTLGYLRTGAINGINFAGHDKDLHVSISGYGDGPFNIKITNPGYAPPLWVGATVGSSTTKLAVGSPSLVGFSNVEKTHPNSTPVFNADSGSFEESAIWTIDHTTLELKAHYVNPDGSKPATVLSYDIRENSIFFTGDLAAFNANNDIPASAIKLFLLQ